MLNFSDPHPKINIRLHKVPQKIITIVAAGYLEVGHSSCHPSNKVSP